MWFLWSFQPYQTFSVIPFYIITLSASLALSLSLSFPSRPASSNCLPPLAFFLQSCHLSFFFITSLTYLPLSFSWTFLSCCVAVINSTHHVSGSIKPPQALYILVFDVYVYVLQLVYGLFLHSNKHKKQHTICNACAHLCLGPDCGPMWVLWMCTHS